MRACVCVYMCVRVFVHVCACVFTFLLGLIIVQVEFRYYFEVVLNRVTTMLLHVLYKYVHSLVRKVAATQQPLWRYTSVQPVVTRVSFWSIVNSSLSHASDVCVALEGVFLHNFRAPFTAKVSSRTHTDTDMHISTYATYVYTRTIACLGLGGERSRTICLLPLMHVLNGHRVVIVCHCV